jgi:hypothetical protein
LLRQRILSGLVLLGLTAATYYTMLFPRRHPLAETALWGLLVLTAFVGYGGAVKRALFRDAKVDPGLYATWGASAMFFVGGVLASMSLLKRPTIVALVLIGVALFAIAIVRTNGTTRSRTLPAILRLARREPIMAFIALMGAALVSLHYLGGIADWHSDPQADDTAYLGFVKKLLDTGSFPEPFSFHRLTALGAQTFFLALVAPHAAVTQPHSFDRGICLVLVVLLAIGYRTSRKPSLLFKVAAVAFLLIVPSVALDTASYFSGVVFFLALFRTLAFLQQRRDPAWVAAIPVALVGATACALRQSYVMVPPAILVVSYGLFVWKNRDRKIEPLYCALFMIVFLLPWIVMLRQSTGVVNAALALDAAGITWVRRIFTAFTVAMEGLPIRTLPVLFVVLVLLRDQGARRPVWALVAGFAATLLVMIASSRQDQWLLARQVFGLSMAIALVAILEAGVQVRRRPQLLGRTTAAAVAALCSVLIELLETRATVAPGYRKMLENIDALLLSDPTTTTTSAGTLLYRRVQDAVPRGERIAVMLDDTGYLDYARNTIFNLDLPGYASPSPGQPFFQGSSKLAEYLHGQSIRYVAFVRPDRSRYQYRRDHWIEQMSDEHDPLRPFAPYIIDTIDNVRDLSAKHRVVFEEHGMTVIDLDAPGEAR